MLFKLFFRTVKKSYGQIKYWRSLLKKGKKYKKRRKEQKYPKIENIVYSVTGACNSHCIHCNMWANKYEKDILSIPELEEILNQEIFSELKYVLLTGGEAMLRPDIKELITCIHKTHPNCGITLSTNGIMADKVLDLAQFAIDNNIVMDYGVSLDGVGENHDHFRGTKGNFKKVDHLIDELLKLKDIYPGKIGVIVLGHTLSDLTIKTLPEALDYANKKGIAIGTQLYEEFDYYSFLEDSESNEEKPRNYRKTKNDDLIKAIRQLPPSLHNEILIKILRHKLNFKCEALNTFVVLEPNGDLAPCLNYSHVLLGNAKGKNIFDVYDSKEAQKALGMVHECKGCSNSWATHWSFVINPRPFLGPYMKYLMHSFFYTIKKKNKKNKCK